MEKLNVIPIDTIKTFVSKYHPKAGHELIISYQYLDRFYITLGNNTYINIGEDFINISGISLSDYYPKKDIKELYDFLASEYPRIINEFLENIKMYLEICR